MSYHTTIDIAAQPDTVWRLLVDVQRWPTWTQSVANVSRPDPAPLRLGSHVRLKQPRMQAMTWTVDSFAEGRSFTWVAHSAGLTTVADHQIEQTTPGCRVTLEVRQSGRLAGLVRLLYGRLTRRYLEMEAEGLRRAAEADEATPTTERSPASG